MLPGGRALKARLEAEAAVEVEAEVDSEAEAEAASLPGTPSPAEATPPPGQAESPIRGSIPDAAASARPAAAAAAAEEERDRAGAAEPAGSHYLADRTQRGLWSPSSSERSLRSPRDVHGSGAGADGGLALSFQSPPRTVDSLLRSPLSGSRAPTPAAAGSAKVGTRSARKRLSYDSAAAAASSAASPARTSRRGSREALLAEAPPRMTPSRTPVTVFECQSEVRRLRIVLREKDCRIMVSAGAQPERRPGGFDSLCRKSVPREILGPLFRPDGAGGRGPGVRRLTLSTTTSSLARAGPAGEPEV